MKNITSARRPTPAMIWLLLAIGFVNLTPSPPRFASYLVEENIIKPSSKGSYPGDQMGRAWALSDDEFQQGHIFNSVMSDIERNHPANLLKRRENGLYFWQNKFFRYKARDSCENLNHMGRRLNELDTSGKIEAMKVDLSMLRQSLGVQREKLDLIQFSANGQTAYEKLNELEEQIEELLFSLFDQKRQSKDSRHSPLHKLDLNLKWKIMVYHVQNVIPIYEELLLNIRFVSRPDQRRASDNLTPEVLKRLNFFLKHSLIQEEFFIERINQPPLLEFLITKIHHAIAFNPILHINFQESLSKSKSIGYFRNVLNFLNQKSWRYIDYQELRCVGISFLNEAHERPDVRLLEVFKSFENSHFRKSDTYDEERKRKVVEDLIHLFSTSPSGVDFLKKDTTLLNCSLWKMVWFVMHYNMELFTKTFGSASDMKAFSDKALILDSAMKCVESAREVEFIAEEGFWSTELDARQSEHLINIEEAQSWSFVPHWETDYFNNEFGIHIESDRVYWAKALHNFALKKNASGTKIPCCVTVKYQYYEPEFFGTNFRWLPAEKESSSLKEKPNIYVKKISTLFLHELYSWIYMLRFAFEKFKKNEQVFLKIAERVESDDHYVDMTEDLRNWIERSPMLQTIYHELRDMLRRSQHSWARIQRKMEILNDEIVSSIQELLEMISQSPPNKEVELMMESMEKQFNSPFPNIQETHAPHQIIQSERKAGLEIPNIKIVTKIPF